MTSPKLTKGRIFRDAWTSFERAAIPAYAGVATRKRAELTFYAGASAILDVFTALADLSDADGVELLESMHQERREFAAREAAAQHEVRDS